MSSTQVPHIIGRCDTRGGSSSRRIERVARVLVVEDDPDIAQLVAHYLEKAGFTAEITPSGRDALTSIAALPQVDGLEICRTIRGNDATAGVPIIILTARAEESDRIVGLEIGADDYLAKPFS